MATVSDCCKDVAPFIVHRTFRLWQRTRPPSGLMSGNTSLYRNFSLSSPYSIPIIPACFNSLSCHLLPYSLAGEIFSCEGIASFRLPSTAPLTGSQMKRQPSQIEDLLPVFPPYCAVGLSIPLNSQRFSYFSLIFPLSGLHVKSLQARKLEQFPIRGK